MPATRVHETQRVFLEEGIAGIGEANVWGLNSAAIGAITSTGTVAKLLAAIDALAVQEQYNVRKSQIKNAIQVMANLGILLDADVETARAASGDKFNALYDLFRSLRAFDVAGQINRNFGLV